MSVCRATEGTICEQYLAVMLYLKDICSEEGVDEIVAPFPLAVVSAMIHSYAHRWNKHRAALYTIGTLLEAKQKLIARQEVQIEIDVDPGTVH